VDRFDWLAEELAAEAYAADDTEWLALEQEVVRRAHRFGLPFVLDPGDRLAVCVGRRGGKTTHAILRYLRRMILTPQARCIYIAPTAKQAKDLLWLPLWNMLAELGIDARRSEEELTCTFRRNGSSLVLRGADDKREAQKSRGTYYHEAGLDECQEFTPALLYELLDKVLTPALGDYNGVLWVAGTPKIGRLAGEFYEATRRGSPTAREWKDREHPDYQEREWSVHRWTLEEAASTGIVPLVNAWQNALKRKRKRGWSDDNPIWRSEYMAEWVVDASTTMFAYRPHDDVTGAPFNQWDPPRLPNGFAKLDPEKEWRFVYGMDMGSRDPFALDVFGYHSGEKTLYHVYEFERQGMYAQEIAKLLLGDELDLAKPSGLIGLTDWPDAFTFDAAGSGQAILDELAHVYGLKFEPAAKTDKLGAIVLFNSDLVEGRIKVLKGSKLEEQLLSQQWELDEFGTPREPRGQRNDHTDAAIYVRRKAMHLLGADTTPKPPPKENKGDGGWNEEPEIDDAFDDEGGHNPWSDDGGGADPWAA
jgi:hypothetical protein